MASYLIIVVAFVLAVLRAAITPRLHSVPSLEGIYESTAHLFCGGLIALRLYDWRGKLGPTRLYWNIGWALALWELCWFLVQKYL